MDRNSIAPLVIALLFAAGCAGSSKQAESDDSKATASSNKSAEENSDEADPAETEKKTEAKTDDHPVVTLKSLIGSTVESGAMPEGCPGEWQKLEGRKFKGDLFACDGFHAAHRYKEPAVVIGIKENKIRRVNLQSFHEPGRKTSEMFREVTDDYSSRCDRIGGAGSRMRLQCDGYLVAIRMQKKGGMLSIVYALKNWDLNY